MHLDSRIIHEEAIEECVEAWRSHATLQRQAGAAFGDVVASIDEYPRSLKTPKIQIPYLTNIWAAQWVEDWGRPKLSAGKGISESGLLQAGTERGFSALARHRRVAGRAMKIRSLSATRRYCPLSTNAGVALLPPRKATRPAMAAIPSRRPLTLP